MILGNDDWSGSEDLDNGCHLFQCDHRMQLDQSFVDAEQLVGCWIQHILTVLEEPVTELVPIVLIY